MCNPCHLPRGVRATIARNNTACIAFGVFLLSAGIALFIAGMVLFLQGYPSTMFKEIDRQITNWPDVVGNNIQRMSVSYNGATFSLVDQIVPFQRLNKNGSPLDTRTVPDTYFQLDIPRTNFPNPTIDLTLNLQARTGEKSLYEIKGLAASTVNGLQLNTICVVVTQKAWNSRLIPNPDKYGCTYPFGKEDQTYQQQLNANIRVIVRYDPSPYITLQGFTKGTMILQDNRVWVHSYNIVPCLAIGAATLLISIVYFICLAHNKYDLNEDEKKEPAYDATAGAAPVPQGQQV